ncbi:MAG: TolC family protein [Janthinobacterium lividum]
MLPALFLIATPAQISLPSALDLALRNDPRVKLAQDDLRRAIAARQEVRDAYLPAANANGGAGYTYGITLTVPTIFTLDAQSLIYSPSQRHYTSASRWELQAAQLGVTNAREQVEEDLALTYMSLANAQETAEALLSAYQHATALSDIVQQRLDAGIENQLEWKQARRTAAQIRLQVLQQQDEQENLRARLAQMTALPAAGLRVVRSSITAVPSAIDSTSVPFRSETLDQARAKLQAQGRRERALADARDPWKPVITFNAQYARVSPINNVTDYYNLQGRYNIFSFGAAVRFPFLDAAARARKRVALADAAHATDEFASAQFRSEDDLRGLRHSIAELAARSDLAELEAGIAADQLTITRKLSRDGGNGYAIANPKDVERAAIQERQRYIALLDTTLQLQRVQLSYLRQTGNLERWVQSTHDTSAPASVSGAPAHLPGPSPLTTAPRRR